MSGQRTAIKSKYKNKDVESLRKKVDSWRSNTLEILNEIQSFAFLHTASFLAINDETEASIDLEEEIKKIEIRMIKRALEISGGNQREARKLLNLKHTTINAKIKRYKIAPKEILFIK